MIPFYYSEFTVYFLLYRKNVSRFPDVRETPFIKVLNSWSGLIIDDPHNSVILMEMSSYP